mmetsp:Transcript_29389/g.30499  ORF Transcript_29389/g.30499 Transcript_29389/m.30499 type:complete len:641 (-) Transcript_29389:9-1931(-)
MIKVTNNPTISSHSATEKVNEIIEKVKQKNSLIANEELVRGEDGESAQLLGVQHRTSRISNSISIVSFSDSIQGRIPETFVEEIQCNLYDEINAEIEARMEEEMLNKPAKDKERNYGYLKKSQAVTKTVEKDINPFKSFMTGGPKEEEEGKKNTNTEDHIKSNQKLEEYKKKLLNSSEVIDFVQTHSRYIERSLGERDLLDLLNTYEKDDEKNTFGDNEDEPATEGEVKEDNKGRGKFLKDPITSMGVFHDESVVFKRAVTDLQWSNKYPEIMLAGYSKSDESNVNDPHGLVLIWSLALRKKPEYQFTCQSELTKVILHPFNPKLILGATHTGQILIWDTRGKPLPIMKTPPGGKYHSHPIYCLAVTGSSSNSNIVSISNDGILCTWSPSNLTKATKRIELKAKKKKVNIDGDSTTDGMSSSSSSMSKPMITPYSEEFGVICMATQENDANNLFIGTDDSEIYQISAHQGADKTENIVESYRHHTGPVMSLDMHPEDFFKNANLTHLFLSSSADWTTSLWSKNFPEGPILTFENNEDYVYQSKFHPVNPSLFGSVDGLGKFDMWDINLSYERPIYSVEMSKNALTKLDWSDDGRRVSVGDSSGKIFLYNVNKEITNSNADDALKLEKILAQAKNSSNQYS